jgi:DNA polymerase III subunit beta
MNVCVNSQVLATELRLLNRIVPNKPAIHILSHALLDARDGKLNFYATDLELGLSSRCDAEVGVPGRMAVPVARLLSMVEQFEDGEVTLGLEAAGKGRALGVASGSFKGQLQALPVDDFPAEPKLNGDASTMDAGALRDLIAQTRYAIDAGSSKHILRGALLTLRESVAALAATDSKRLAVATAARPEGPNVRIIVPAKTLDALAQQPTGDEVTIVVGLKHIFFQSADRTLTSRTIDGAFPAYERIIPRANDKQIVVGRTALAASLRRVKLVAEETLAVSFALDGDGNLALAASSAEIGAAAENVRVEYAGPPIKVTVNGQHVLDFLNAARNGQITLSLKDAKSAMLATDGTDPAAVDHLAVILLMK